MANIKVKVEVDVKATPEATTCTLDCEGQKVTVTFGPDATGGTDVMVEVHEKAPAPAAG
jgi:hypothetical protein